jgi:methionyl-tRNA synthetase
VDIKDFFADEQEKEKKVEKKKVNESKPKEQKKEEDKATEGLITFDEFQKVQMVTAKVVDAEPHPNADRLLKLTVDTGTDERTLVAGIAKYYTPEELKGKKIIIVKNLKPVKLRGILSQGMILAASTADGRPYIPIVPEETPVGAILK